MVSNTKTNIHSVGGSSLGAMTADQAANEMSIYRELSDKSLEDAGREVLSAASHQYSSFTDTEESDKYAADPEVANFAGGAISVQPEMGKFVLANTHNEESNPVFKADGKNSQMYSSSATTTLGSTTVDTVSGYDMNILSNALPSTFFTPLKTWFLKLFPILTDGRLLTIAIVQGCILILQRYIKLPEGETYRSTVDDDRDIVIMIQDNQEFENWILEENAT